MARSARPRTPAGSSSSTAELMAEYSPPIPVPVRKRNRAKGANPHEIAVSAVAVVYTPSVTRKSFLRPRESVRRPKKRAPRIAPSKYALADRPIWLSDRCSVEDSVSTVPTEPTRVTSSPSNIQVIPRATTTRTCHLDQGSLSSRPGILVTIQLPCARGVSSTVSPHPFWPSTRRGVQRHLTRTMRTRLPARPWPPFVIQAAWIYLTVLADDRCVRAAHDGVARHPIDLARHIDERRQPFQTRPIG